MSVTAYERCSCPDEDHCGLRMLMLDVRNAIARILDRYVLADVVGITLRKMRRDGVPIPFMVEQLLEASPRRKGRPACVDEDPAGGFLAELAQGTARVKRKRVSKK